MPYFSWHGITMHGQARRGIVFALSTQELDAALLKRGVALLTCKQASAPLVVRSIASDDICVFLRQLSLLLSSGILLPEALIIVNEHIRHPLFQEIIQSIALEVNQGKPLSVALAPYPKVFNHMIVQVVYVGQESGTLSPSLALLADHLEKMQIFSKQVQSAALLPGLTFIFLIVVACGVIVGIIPQFAALLACCNQELPPLTRALISLTHYATSRYMLVIVAIVSLCVLKIGHFARSVQGAQKVDEFIVRLPFIGGIVTQCSLYYYVRSLALLLEGGMRLPAALAIAQNVMPNRTMQNHAALLSQEVEAGSSLSSAMAHHHQFVFDAKLISMIKVGEESGDLGELLQSIGRNYHENITRSLSRITVLFQPALMIVLGLLITLLIVALYMPILHLSSVVR